MYIHKTIVWVLEIPFSHEYNNTCKMFVLHSDSSVFLIINVGPTETP